MGLSVEWISIAEIPRWQPVCFCRYKITIPGSATNQQNTKMKRTLALILPAFAVFAHSAQAASLLIDFNRNGAGAVTQTGWQSYSQPTGNTSQIYSGFTDLSTTGNLTISVTGIAFERFYNNSGTTPDSTNVIGSTGAVLTDMYRDLIFRNNTSDEVEITVTGLKAGTYTFTTHHLYNSGDPSQFNLNVQDADSSAFSQVVGSYTMGTASTVSTVPFNPTVISFDVVSNGTDPITLQMVGTTLSSTGTTGGWFGINGLEIVPEPSSLTLLGLGCLLFLRRRR